MKCDQCDDECEHHYCDACWNALKYGDYSDEEDDPELQKEFQETPDDNQSPATVDIQRPE